MRSHLTSHRRISGHHGLRLALALAALLSSAAGHAADIDSQTPTFFVNATGGYSVYKSKMVQSNDTSTTVAYGFGVYAGSDRNIGFLLNREASTFAFELNSASIGVEWQDIHVRYRYGPVYMGALITTSTWAVQAPPDADADGLLDADTEAVEYLNMTSSGYGANVGARIPAGKRGEAYVDITYAAAGAIRETASDPDVAEAAGAAVPGTRVLGIGPRMDLDLGGSIGMTKWLKGLCGFKYRTYQLSVDSVTFAELHTTTYMGLGAGWDF